MMISISIQTHGRVFNNNNKQHQQQSSSWALFALSCCSVALTSYSLSILLKQRARQQKSPLMEVKGSTDGKSLGANLHAPDLRFTARPKKGMEKEKESTDGIKLDANLQALDLQADQLNSNTDELEKRVKKVVEYYENNEELTDGAPDKSGRSKRMKELMQQFRKILLQIKSHRWAFPFQKPVDAKGLELYDYHEVIKKPMDLGTILNCMDAKDENCRYKNVNDICADVRLVFNNAMVYNDRGSHVHTMAQELSSEFEKLWYPLSLKVAEEERRQQQHEMQEATIEKLAQETDEELAALSVQLKELRQHVMSNFRKMSSKEKMRLADDFTKMSIEDMNKAVEIGAKYDPNLDVSSADVVEIDFDSMNVIAQWKVHQFVQNALNRKEKKERERKQARVEAGSSRKTSHDQAKIA